MLTTNPELEAYLVPSRPWIDALATWLVPNKLSSTKFCQLIRSDRKEKVSFYFVGTSSKVSLTFKLRLIEADFFTDWISSSCNAFISVTIHREKTRPQSQSSLPRKFIGGKVYESSPFWQAKHMYEIFQFFMIIFLTTKYWKQQWMPFCVDKALLLVLWSKSIKQARKQLELQAKEPSFLGLKNSEWC